MGIKSLVNYITTTGQAVKARIESIDPHGRMLIRITATNHKDYRRNMLVSTPAASVTMR